MLQGAWDLPVLGRYFALASLVLCLLALVVVLLRKVLPACASTLFKLVDRFLKPAHSLRYDMGACPRQY